jgi:hypothetical protein
MLQADIEFTSIYETGIRNVMIRICGFDEIRDEAIIQEAEKMDKEIASLSINLKQ